ncbi:MAG: MFS transporter, partial [Clostridia bacterium]
NFCAFALQLPLGIWADLRKRQMPFAVLGCAFVALAFLLVPVSPGAGCVLAGVGNGFFHVGGGVTVLRTFPKKAAPLGIFVSPGALGVFFGLTLGKSGFSGAVVFPLLLLFAAVLLFLLGKGEEPVLYRPGASLKKIHIAAVLGVLMLFLAVVLRSYLGLIFSFPWKTGFGLSFLVIFGVAAGKAFGGFFSDRFGLIPTALASLSLCAVLLIFAGNSAVCGILAVCCFNMTMPLTLFALSEILGDAKGFAFGLTTFALFLGTLPSLISLPAVFSGTAFEILLTAISAFLILSGVAMGGIRR